MHRGAVAGVGASIVNLMIFADWTQDAVGCPGVAPVV